MRRAALSALLVAAALVLQLTAVNRLPLPGGGAPDLVLLVVIALALRGGPETGMLTGFCAGLSLDLAPPASQLIGEYALVFCIVGYGCGKLRGTLGRSALLQFAAAAAAAAAGEALYAGLGLALDPAQVTGATVRQVLPSSVVYDVVVSSPVLFLVMLAGRWVDDRAGAGLPEQRQAGGPGLAGRSGLPGWLAGPRGSRAPAWRAPARGLPRRAAPRLRPGAGLAGSAVRGQQAGSPQLRPPAGRLHPAKSPRIAFSGRRGRGSTASWSRGAGRGTVRPGAGSPARSPAFRPSVGFRGGSLAGSRPHRPAGGRPASPRLHTARRRDAVVGGGMLTGRGPSGRRRAVTIRFRPGRAVGFRPGRAVGFRPGRAVGFRPGRAVGFRPGRAIRFGSGRRSVVPAWVLGKAGRRSNAGRIGSRRTGGSR